MDEKNRNAIEEIIPNTVMGVVPILLAGTGADPMLITLAAASGEAAAKVILNGLPDIVHKQLSDYERNRINIFHKFVVAEINAQKKNNNKIRNDNFIVMDDDDSNRSPVSEIAEKIYNVVYKEFEQKKIKHIAKLMVYILYHSELSKEDALFYIDTAAELSFRQLQLMAYLGEKTRLINKPLDQKNTILIKELFDIANKELCENKLDDNNSSALLSYEDIPPSGKDSKGSEMRLTKIGLNLYIMMGLEEVEYKDIMSDLAET